MPSTITHIRPMLAVTGLPRTLALYRDKLGFRCTSTFGEPPAMNIGLWFVQETNEAPTIHE